MDNLVSDPPKYARFWTVGETGEELDIDRGCTCKLQLCNLSQVSIVKQMKWINKAMGKQKMFNIAQVYSEMSFRL